MFRGPRTLNPRPVVGGIGEGSRVQVDGLQGENTRIDHGYATNDFKIGSVGKKLQPFENCEISKKDPLFPQDAQMVLSPYLKQ